MFLLHMKALTVPSAGGLPQIVGVAEYSLVVLVATRALALGGGRLALEELRARRRIEVR